MPDCLSPFDFGLFVKGGLMGDIIILESSSLFFSRGVCLSTLRRFACLALEPEPKAGMAISSAKIGSDTGLDKDRRSGIVPMLLPLEEGCDPTPRSSREVLDAPKAPVKILSSRYSVILVQMLWLKLSTISAVCR